MRDATYTDERGRQWKVLLPDGVPESEASMGIPAGPPALESLGLPEEVEVRLHNQLFARRLFTLKDAKARPADVMGALMATLKIDKGRILALYLEAEGAGGRNGKRPVSSEDEPDKDLDHRRPGRTVTRPNVSRKGARNRSGLATRRRNAG